MPRCHLCKQQVHCQSNGKMCNNNVDKFVPKDEVRRFFSSYFVGFDEMGNSQYVTHVDLSNPDLSPTHYVVIGNHPYCPYCGERAIHADVGYCCICDGALAEVEYNKEFAELEAKQRREQNELRMRWRDKLSFNLDKMLEVKHSQEKTRANMWKDNANHFLTINGNSITNLEDLL